MSGLSIVVPGTVFTNAKFTVPGSLAEARREMFPTGSAPNGFWFDPWDKATLFQDSAGTVPVTASGQAVGKMLDKSGNDNHAVQSDNSKRPVYTEQGGRSFLLFDTGDFMDAVFADGQQAKAKRTLLMAMRYTGGDGGNLTLAEAYENDPNTNTNSWSALALELTVDGPDVKLNAGANYPDGPDVTTAYAIDTDDVVGYRVDYVDDATICEMEIRSLGTEVYSQNINPTNASTTSTGIRLFAGREKDDAMSGRLYGAAYVRSYVDMTKAEQAFASHHNISLPG